MADEEHDDTEGEGPLDPDSCEIPAELVQLHEIIEWDATVQEAAQ